MSKMNSALNENELVTLLEGQQVVYRRLRLLSERQRSLVVQDDPQPLLALLSERQQLVDELVALNDRLAAYRSRWSEVFDGLGEASRNRVTRLLEEANASLGAILQNDNRDSAALAAKREHMVRQMEVVGTGSRASAAYAASARQGAAQMTDARA